jgi:hypothetical protein
MARKGHGRPATLVNINTHPDDGSSPVGSNEWNANRDTTGVIGFTKKTEAVSSNNINITDSYVEVTSSGNEEIRTMSQVTTALLATNYISDTTTKSFAEGDLLYLVKANASHAITLKNQYGGSGGAGKITTLTGGDLLLDVKVPRIFMCRTIGSNQEWVEYGGGSASNLDTTNFTAATIVTESDTIAGNDNDTTLPTSAAVKDYVDTQITAEDLDTAGDSGTGAIDLNSQSLTVSGGSGITTTASNQAITIAGDDATTSAKGVASFSSDNFAVSSGAVTIKTGGVVEAEIADNAVTLAKMAGLVRGKIIVGDANGNPSALTVGAEDTVLTVDASGDVGWESPAGGGATSTHDFTANSSTTYTGTADGSRFGASGAGQREIYIKKIDANNEGVFTKIFKNGSATEVQIA